MFTSFSARSQRQRESTVQHAAMIKPKVNSVPMVALSLSRFPAPMCWEMMTCPALAKPMPIKRKNMASSPLLEAAASPAEPTYWPMMTMSAML